MWSNVTTFKCDDICSYCISMCQHYFLWDVNKLPFTIQREIADDTIFTDNVRKGNFQNLLGIYSDRGFVITRCGKLSAEELLLFVLAWFHYDMILASKIIL